jgi:hypothetical protein
MKYATTFFAIVGAALLASTQLVVAQGTSGSTGAIASIPSSIVRAGEQGRPVAQPGLISILTGSDLPDPKVDSKPYGARRSGATAPPK